MSTVLAADVLSDKKAVTVAIERNLKAKLSYIASISKCMRVEQIGSTQVVDSGYASDTFNTAFDGKINPEIISEAIGFYAQINFPFAWWLGEASQSELAQQALQSAGFVFDEENIGMGCALKNLNEQLYNHEELEVKSCVSEQDFNDFGELIASLFDPKDSNVEAYYQYVSKIPAEKRVDIELFIGYENDKPVSTAALFKTDVAGFYDISTKPSKRRKGYGSRMLIHAMNKAYGDGYRVGILQASPDGLNIYRQQGFTDNCCLHVWNKD